jgi:hypothetical protein
VSGYEGVVLKEVDDVIPYDILVHKDILIGSEPPEENGQQKNKA